MVPRPQLLDSIVRLLGQFPVCTLLGPRQSGKSTIAAQVAREHGKATWFDLETDEGLRALEQPELVLKQLRGLVVIDEVQRLPDLFRILRPIVDRRPLKARFLLLGSASFDLAKGVSESLAGRSAVLEMGGFSLAEVGAKAVDRLWLRGGFPRAYLARSELESQQWRAQFVRSFLERDIPQLGIRVPSATLRRFWTMVAHFHGGIWNAAEFARSLGQSENTARHYLDVLTGAFVVRQLQPWFENLAKRQVKAPKVYVRDSGLLHTLLDIRSRSDLFAHVRRGASWEGFAIEQLLSVTKDDEAYFWSTHSGAELDLLWVHRGRRVGFEVKSAAAPAMSRSLAVALTDLKLERAFIVGGAGASYPVHERVEVTSLPQAVDWIQSRSAQRR